MSAPAQTLDVRQFLTNHMVDVFDTMLSMKATPQPDGLIKKFPEHVVGSVGFAGDNVTGALYLHLSAAFAARITSAMLGLPPEETAGETEINDVIGECANMLTGGLKSALCDAGYICAVSTPAIIRGASFQVEAMPHVRREVLVFESDGNCVGVELHIKYS